MHRDVLAGRKFELASLTEFVVNEGLKYEMELRIKWYWINTGFQELINAICCNAAKESCSTKSLSIKRALVHRGCTII
jgi:hypothetical protein